MLLLTLKYRSKMKEGACLPRLDWEKNERATRRASKLLCGESSGRGPSRFPKYSICFASEIETVLIGYCIIMTSCVQASCVLSAQELKGFASEFKFCQAERNPPRSWPSLLPYTNDVRRRNRMDRRSRGEGGIFKIWSRSIDLVRVAMDRNKLNWYAKGEPSNEPGLPKVDTDRQYKVRDYKIQ